MAHLERTVVTLRISGDTLMPDEISRLLGSPPTKAQTKGESLVGKVTGNVRVSKFGMWRLETSDCEPENLDGQIKEIFGKLSDDLDVWSKICSRFKVDMFCGLFMGSSNEGLSLSPQTLVALGQRGIKLDLDIYGPDEEVKTV